MAEFSIGIISDWLRLPFAASMENVRRWARTGCSCMRWTAKWRRKT